MEEKQVVPTLTIDPEFQNKIPPLSEAEYKQLEENILNAGEVWEPIVTWNGVIVDGHNRYKIVQEHPEIKWRTREIDFQDKWDAFDWMYKNQLGRRNLTDEQRTYLLGKLYEARKHTEVFKGNQYTVDGGAQNEHNQTRTADKIAKEQCVGKETVKRAEKFAQGVDAIREQEPETAEAILNGKTNVTKQDVMAIAKARDEQRQQMIEAIKNREPLNPKPKKEKERAFVAGTQENRELNNRLNDVIGEMYGDVENATFTIDMLLTTLKSSAEQYIESLSRDIHMHTNLLTQDGKAQIIKMIDDVIVSKIQIIRSEIENAQ